MIQFLSSQGAQKTALVTITVGSTLDDALAQFGQQDDCIGCSTTVAALPSTSDRVIETVLDVFSPLAKHGSIIRPMTSASGLFRRGGVWTDVDIDTRAQRLRTIKMPSELVGAQRLLVAADLRENREIRPTVAIGLWAFFAHPFLRTGARLAGTRDGLTAEIALAVHPDRYILLEQDRSAKLDFVIETADPIAADLVVLALRQQRARVRGTGAWEDPLIQAATELELGIRTVDQLTIDTILSPTLSIEQRTEAIALVRRMAESIGVRDVT